MTDGKGHASAQGAVADMGLSHLLKGPDQPESKWLRSATCRSGAQEPVRRWEAGVRLKEVGARRKLLGSC